MAVESSVGVSKENLADFQSVLGCVLPDGYRNYLLKTNGMFLSGNTFCEIDFKSVDDGFVAFQEFYSVGAANPNMNILKVNRYVDGCFSDLCPVVVGGDPGGNLFVISCSDSSIYYWDRMHIHSGGMPTFYEREEEGDLYKISDNFDSFLKLVSDCTSGDLSTLEVNF